MDEFLRGLQRQWLRTGSPEDGVEYLRALLRSQPIDLADFPTDVLRRANLPISSRDFRSKNLLYGDTILGLLGILQNTMQGYWEILQPEPIPEGAIPAFDRIAFWFAENNLLEEQAVASQQVVGAPEYDDDYYDPGIEYDSEEIFYDLIVWYPDTHEIRVFTASQYADTYGDLIADFSEGHAQVPQNIPDPMGVLREFVFRLGYDGAVPEGWQLVGINVVAHQQGLWSGKPRAETLETLITTSEWRGQSSLPTSNRRNYFVLIDEITPAMPLNVAPNIERGRCEDYPACGHAERDEYGSMRAFCPPRWSHTGRHAGMICAICGGEMPLGPSSIHPACYRREMAREDPYGYPEDFPEEDEYDDDRAFYEEGDDYDYR